MNHCGYSLAVLKGKVLRKNHIIKPFGVLIQRKIKKRLEGEKKFEWPHNPEEVIREWMLDRGSHPEIYNAI